VEQVLVPVLVMVGATLLVMLAIPLGFLAVSGFYFARRTATWLVPLMRRTAADTRRSAAEAWRSAVDLGVRAVHQVTHSRLPQALATGALGCALALPAFAAPVRDMEPGWGRYPQQHIADLAGAGTEAGVAGRATADLGVALSYEVTSGRGSGYGGGTTGYAGSTGYETTDSTYTTGYVAPGTNIGGTVIGDTEYPGGR